MIVLLDTNALYWWLNDPARLGVYAESAIADESNTVVISAVVPWELAIMTNLGKLHGHPLLSVWKDKLAAEGFSELPIESSHTIRAGLLPRHHKDPFDRLLAAQAQATAWPIISSDPVFDLYGIRRIW